MFFQTVTQYALCTLAALPEDGSYRQAGALAQDLGLPAHYLPKILRALVRGGILESLTGPEGGFRLARPAHRITVGEVRERLQGRADDCACVLGRPAPEGHRHPCAIFDAWQAVLAMTIRDLSLVRCPAADGAGPDAAGRDLTARTPGGRRKRAAGWPASGAGPGRRAG